ncbi:MAG: nitroreductase family protein [Spirochaetes bacterium]|nr:nitroreductase family protein [Spirochaetota bacterium]
MPTIIVNKEKCKKDKLCVMECPMKIITVDNDGIPQTLSNAETLCIECGHCVAVCPHGALSLTTLPSSACKAIVHNWNPGAEVIENYFKARRSIRRFKKDDVEREKLIKLIEITAYAPSGHNSRTVEYIVFTQRDRIEELITHVVDWMRIMLKNSPDIAHAFHFDMITKAWEEGIDVITHSAPVVIIAHGQKSNPNTSTSCTIALAHMELIAPSLGLGCCWAGYISWCALVYSPLKKALNLPEGDAVYGTMLVGYPKVTYYRVPERSAKVQWR